MDEGWSQEPFAPQHAFGGGKQYTAAMFEDIFAEWTGQEFLAFFEALGEVGNHDGAVFLMGFGHA